MSKIEFHEITLDDKSWMDARFQEDDRNACEYTFANNFVWRKVYHVEVAEKSCVSSSSPMVSSITKCKLIFFYVYTLNLTHLHNLLFFLQICYIKYVTYILII